MHHPRMLPCFYHAMQKPKWLFFIIWRNVLLSAKSWYVVLVENDATIAWMLLTVLPFYCAQKNSLARNAPYQGTCVASITDSHAEVGGAYEWLKFTVFCKLLSVPYKVAANLTARGKIIWRWDLKVSEYLAVGSYF